MFSSKRSYQVLFILFFLHLVSRQTTEVRWLQCVILVLPCDAVQYFQQFWYVKLILFGKIPLQFSAIYEVVELLFKLSQENCVANAKRISIHLKKKKKSAFAQFPNVIKTTWQHLWSSGARHIACEEMQCSVVQWSLLSAVLIKTITSARELILQRSTSNSRCVKCVCNCVK